MSFTQLGYPSAFASEGDPGHGGFPGDFNPHVHTVNDTMYVDDNKGYFSINVSFCLYSLKPLLTITAYGTLHRVGDRFCCGARWMG
jgi:hypothetical protein